MLSSCMLTVFYNSKFILNLNAYSYSISEPILRLLFYIVLVLGWYNQDIIFLFLDTCIYEQMSLKDSWYGRDY